LQEKTPITDTDNAGTIHDKLMAMGASMVRKTIDLLAEGKTDAIDQAQFISSETTLKAAPKIFKETGEIDFSKTATEVHNFVRGLSPYPGAWTEILLPVQPEKVVLKVFETDVELTHHTLTPGTIETDGKKYLKIATPDGFVQLISVQYLGKKRMEIGELLRGLK